MLDLTLVRFKHFFKRGIREYAKSIGKTIVKGNYAKLAYDLGLKDIIIAEYDSQKTHLRPTKKKFINTWSCMGYELEASDNVMLSLDNESIAEMEASGITLIKPNEGNAKNLIFLDELGLNVKRSAITLDHDGNPFEYEGLLIPHAEICSLSEFLQYRGNAPNIMYVYRSCDSSIESLGNLKTNKYKVLPDYHVLESDDILPHGFDSIGALMKFDNCLNYWCGSVLSIEDTRQLGFKVGGPTGVQVAGFLYACIDFMINNPDYGHNESETVPHKELFKLADKYMGKIYCKQI